MHHADLVLHGIAMCINHVSDSYHRVGENQSSNNIYTLAERLLDVNAREASLFLFQKITTTT